MTYSLRKALAKGTSMDRKFGPPRMAQYTAKTEYVAPKQSVTLEEAEIRDCMRQATPELQWKALQMVLTIKGVPPDYLVGMGIMAGARDNGDGTITVEW